MTMDQTQRSMRHPAAFPTVGLLAMALSLVLLITACNASGDAAARELTSQQVVLQEVLDMMLREPHEGAAQAYLASLPAPSARQSRNVTNAYDPRQRDEIETLAYDGLSITVYHVNATDRMFPVEVTVSARGPRTADGLQVGLTRTEVRDQLGPPTAPGNGTSPAQQATLPTWHYARVEDGSTPYALDISFQDDVVTVLRWTVQVE